MEAFPVTYAEVLTPTVLATYIPAGKQKPHFAKYQTLLAGKLSGGVGESSACLLMALKTLASDGVSVEDQLSYAVANTDGKNAATPTLIDAWGTPMAFFRFPTGGIAQAANPATVGSTAAKFSDPTDSGGTLLNSTWYNATSPPSPTNRQTFESQFHPITPTQAWVAKTPPQTYNVGDSVFYNSTAYRCILANSSVLPTNAANWTPSGAYYVIPVIVSAGKDRRFGLNNVDVNGNDIFPLSPEMSLPTLQTPYDQDNIYSFTLRGD